MCLNLKQSTASWANEKRRWKRFHVMYIFRPTYYFGLVLLRNFLPAVGGFCNHQLYAFYSVLPCVHYWHTCAFWFRDSYCSVPAMTYSVDWALKTSCLLCWMCWCSVSTFRNCSGCAGLDIPAWREMIEQMDWQTLPAGTKPMVSRNWSPKGERHGQRKRPKDLPWKNEIGPLSVWQTLKLSSKAKLRKCPRDGVEHII